MKLVCSRHYQAYTSTEGCLYCETRPVKSSSMVFEELKARISHFPAWGRLERLYPDIPGLAMDDCWRPLVYGPVDTLLGMSNLALNRDLEDLIAEYPDSWHTNSVSLDDFIYYELRCMPPSTYCSVYLNYETLNTSFALYLVAEFRRP